MSRLLEPAQHLIVILDDATAKLWRHPVLVPAKRLPKVIIDYLAELEPSCL